MGFLEFPREPTGRLSLRCPYTIPLPPPGQVQSQTYHLTFPETAPIKATAPALRGVLYDGNNYHRARACRIEQSASMGVLPKHHILGGQPQENTLQTVILAGPGLAVEGEYRLPPGGGVGRGSAQLGEWAREEKRSELDQPEGQKFSVLLFSLSCKNALANVLTLLLACLSCAYYCRAQFKN